jgi:hypothetical protein
LDLEAFGFARFASAESTAEAIVSDNGVVAAPLGSFGLSRVSASAIDELGAISMVGGLEATEVTDAAVRCESPGVRRIS